MAVLGSLSLGVGLSLCIVFGGKELVDVLPQQRFVILELLPVPLILEKIPQLLLAKLSCKRNEFVVVGHLSCQHLQGVNGVFELPLHSGICEEFRIRLLAQRRHQVLVCCDVDVEPEAPWSLDRSLPAKTVWGFVEVAQHGFHGVGIVVFELDRVEFALLRILLADDV